MSADKLSPSERASTKAPLELENSGVDFAIFGHRDHKSVIAVKSGDAPLELLGSYPLEAIETSPLTTMGFLLGLLDVSTKPVHWIMSSPFSVALEKSQSDRLVLVWQGLATANDKLLIKKVLDRNALDIDEAAKSDDHWRCVMSASPVIAQCERAQVKNKRLRILLWMCAVIIVLVALSRALA
jgi:hypothetical protein